MLRSCRVSPAARLPLQMNIELTSRCNQRCLVCCGPGGRNLSSANRGPMTEDTWRQVKTAALEIGHIAWTGFGEVLLHPRWQQYMTELDDAGVYSGFSTNGALLTEEACRTIGGLRNGVHVNVSIDSFDEEIFSMMRGGALAPVLAGLKNLLRHIDVERVTVSSVMTRLNFASLPEVPRRLAALGVRHYVLQSLQESRAEFTAGVIGSLPRIAATYEQIVANAAQAGVAVRLEVPERFAAEATGPGAFARDYVFNDEVPHGISRACLVPWEVPFCDKDGNVFPCANSTWDADYAMGNLREATLSEIWNGPRFVRFRRSLADGIPIPAACRRCTLQRKAVHPTKAYAAHIPAIQQWVPEVGHVRLTVRNTGAKTWEQGTVLVGSARPHDHHSPLHASSWISPNRVCSFIEGQVPTGGDATFEFDVGNVATRDNFELVIDGQLWIPESGFVLAINTPVAA